MPTYKQSLTARNVIRVIGVISMCLGVAVLSVGPAGSAEKPQNHGAPALVVDFNRDVRPILTANCFACHGQDATTRQAGLRLDLRESAIGKRNGVPAIAPGKPESSALVARVTAANAALIMPPPSSGRRLTAEQKITLTLWIRQGARYEPHWAFKRLALPATPIVRQKRWAKSPLDTFVLARLEKTGLAPSAEADRYTLNRRLALDLTGLPPTLAEMRQFLNDRSPNAYEKLVDRLLASPHYGEHWARMWLDLARYADTQGYEKDQPRTMWRYRDWVIDAFNADMPYDQFTIEQLAGDLLPNPTSSQILATAFHRNTMTNTEGGVDNEEFRVAAVKDRVDTTGQVWMGLTVGCAKCHSHKYDPITQQDYYRFYALFNQTEDNNNYSEGPTAPMPTSEQLQREATLRERQKTLLDALKKPNPPKETIQRELAGIEKDLSKLESEIPKIPILRELPVEKQRVTHVQQRGNFLDPGEVVTADVPAAFGALPSGTPHNRLGAARWLVSPDNSLTPRVAVNRVWARLFGTGLVETEEDFGTQGTPPTHPELLDWLAVTFRDDLHWSMKRLCKTIVMSATYRQTSIPSEAARRLDPRNLLFSRGPRFRLTAEMVRDQALAVSGLLSPKLHGPSVMPPQPEGIWRAVYSGLKWQTSPGEDRYRRALYTFWRRSSPYPSMTTFDAGSGEYCVVRRVRTNTPLQALVTLNDPVFVEAAAGLGREMLTEPVPDVTTRLISGFRRVLMRPPLPVEIARLNHLYEVARTAFRRKLTDARALLNSAHAVTEDAETVPEQAGYTLVANVLLNLDETLTKP